MQEVPRQTSNATRLGKSYASQPSSPSFIAGAVHKTPPVCFKTEDIKTLSLPIGTPHPHFPCLAIIESTTNGIMEGVVEGIDETGDDVLWISTPENDNHNVSATVFLGGERISISVHLFATPDRKEDGGYYVLLQALCHGGYGWNFFTIWDAIVMELKACAKKVQRFIPQIEEDPAKMSKQPSLSEQLRSSQIPAQYSTASNPAPENLPEITEEDFAPAPPPASEPRADTAVNLLRAPYEHERGTGLELLAAEMDSEKKQKANVRAALRMHRFGERVFREPHSRFKSL
eukprot:gb/GECG01016441.1/.p1 GENE.gb/GECG01016441.1/~~gb/GECG01016441.1/.p1  ORF type:complete len:288 (+),score=32.32 gb/GECG01016441.1/:1-864(+)